MQEIEEVGAHPSSAETQEARPSLFQRRRQKRENRVDQIESATQNEQDLALVEAESGGPDEYQQRSWLPLV